MSRIQYASGRQQICPLNVGLTTGNLSTGNTYYFWVQGRNDIGYNQPSPVSTITSAGSDGITLTIPADCYRTGENWSQFVISANTTNSALSATVISVIDATDPVNQNPITLPKVITLSEDAHLDLSRVGVATFPTGADLIEGLVREYSVNGLLYRYDPDSTATPDGTNVIAASVGNWVRYVDDFNNNVVDTQNITNGCDVPILDITDNSRLLPIHYSVDGSQGQYRRLWIVNTNSTANIPKGERIGFVITVNGQTASEDFEGLLKVVFEGLSDTTTGILDTLEDDLITPLDDVGVEKAYSFEASDLIIPKDVEPGETWQCRVFPEFNSFQLRNLPSYLANVAAFPFIFPDSGTYNDASAIIGNAILPDPDTLRRAYPSTGLQLFVDEGSGTVGGYFFSNKASVNVTNLLANTASQILVINNNGEVYIDTAIQDFEDQRALISTVSGESQTSGYSTAVTGDASPNIDVTVEYPSTIRSNYNDVIAGSSQGTFNAEEVVLYIRKNSTEIRKFTGFVPTNTTSDVFQAVWSSGSVVANTQSSDFGLWSPETPTTVVSSTTGTDSYEVAVGFSYLGNSVTDIDHSSVNGSIQELPQTILDLLESNRYWQIPSDTTSSLAALDSSDLLAYETRLTYENNEIALWTWVPTLINDTPGITVRPDDILLANPGRWVRSNNRSWKDSIATYTDLTALVSSTLTDYEVRVVYENGVEFWTYDPTSTNNNADESLRPDDILLADPGRWLNELSGISIQDGGTPVASTSTINFIGTSSVTESAGVVTVDVTPAGTTISVEEEGVQVVNAITVLNFVGDTVTATNPSGNQVDVTVADNSHTIQNEGTPLAQTGVLNFTGSGVVATDNGGTSTDVTITGNTSSTADGNLETLVANLSLAIGDSYYQILDGGASDRDIDLYNGGSTFRQHFILNSGSTNALDVRNEVGTLLSNLAPGEQAFVLWDTSQWRLL